MNALKRLWRRWRWKQYPHVVQGSDGQWYIRQRINSTYTKCLLRYSVQARSWSHNETLWSTHGCFETRQSAVDYYNSVFPLAEKLT